MSVNLTISVNTLQLLCGPVTEVIPVFGLALMLGSDLLGTHRDPDSMYDSSTISEKTSWKQIRYKLNVGLLKF